MDQDALLDLLARKDNRAYQYLYRCYYVALKALANYYVKDNDVAEGFGARCIHLIARERIQIQR